MPHAIVIGLPWARGGTGQVMARQLAFLKQLGFSTTFAAIASHYEGGFDEAQWQRFTELAPELGADNVIISRFADLGAARRVWEAGKALTKGQNAMHWALAPAHFTQPSLELLDTLAREDIPLLLANHVYTLPFAIRLKSILESLGKRVPLLAVTHDVQAHILLDRDAKAPWRRETERESVLIATETEWLRKADALMHVSIDDLAFFKARLPDKRHATVFPSFAQMTPAQSAPAEFSVLHVASAHPGNVESLAWYFHHVTPLMRMPPRHIIVGQIGGHAKEFLPHGVPGWVELAGEAADLKPYYNQASCIVCPTTRGRGISVKTIEAFAAGVPVIGTPLAFRGMPQDALASVGIEAFSNAEDFAAAVMTANSAQFQKKQRTASQKMFSSYFSSDAAFEAFAAAVTSLNIK
jgi:polysaccharide biosynthesis protein PslH